MDLEFRKPLVGDNEWHPVTSIEEIFRKAAYFDIFVGDADTKENIKLQDLPGARVNGGTLCDVSSGPCNCGAWH